MDKVNDDDSKTPKKRKRVSLSRKRIQRSPSLDSGDLKPQITKKGHKRHLRCKQCEGCLRESCGSCINCRDMPKFGGLGKSKQACIHRKCESPLPENSQLAITAFFCSPHPKTEKTQPKEPSEDTIPPQPGFVTPLRHSTKNRPKGNFEEGGSVLIDLSEPGSFSFLFFLPFFSSFSSLFFFSFSLLFF